MVAVFVLTVSLESPLMSKGLVVCLDLWCTQELLNVEQILFKKIKQNKD